MRQIKISSGAWQKDLEMVVTVIDEDKFKTQCEQVNKFHCDSEYRAKKYGSHEKRVSPCSALSVFNKWHSITLKMKNG